MDGHLVAVEVGVVSFTDERVNLDRVAFHQHRLEGLDAHAVQGRGTVEQDGVFLDDIVEDVPHPFVFSLKHLFSALDGIRQTHFLEATNDERLEQLECDFLGQAALVEGQFGADHDYRTGGIVAALSEKVFTEATLLTLDHVGERLERTVAAAEHRALAPLVVEK